MGVSGQGYPPVALYPQVKDPRYPLYRRLGVPQSRSGHRGQRKNPLPLPGIELRSPGRPALSQTLYRLSYFSYHTMHVTVGNINRSLIVKYAQRVQNVCKYSVFLHCTPYCVCFMCMPCLCKMLILFTASHCCVSTQSTRSLFVTSSRCCAPRF
jgi:hypothetical protein